MLVFVENGKLQDPEKAHALPLCQSSFHTTTIKLRNLTCGRSSKVIPHQPKRGEGGGQVHGTPFAIGFLLHFNI